LNDNNKHQIHDVQLKTKFFPMKKLILTILSIAALGSQVAFSQDTTSSYRPKAGERVITIGLNNNSAYWACKKYKTNTLAYRFGITGSYSITPKTITDGIDYGYNYSRGRYQNNPYTKTEKASQYAIGITGGFQKSIGDHKRIEPYLGLDMNLSYRYANTSSVQEYQPGSAYYQTITNETKNPLALSLYLSPLVGLNYYIMPRVAIGAEYGINLVGVNYSANAETKNEIIYSPNTSQPNNMQSTKQNDGALGVSGGITGRALITLTFYLK
jgi:hypothetical protein